ncbi:MAG: hypothetical protein NTY53_13465 [Kiritimatiellaeota bacterium]|nr:hypothetical protein [Kiritimatiellota bacterium]
MNKHKKQTPTTTEAAVLGALRRVRMDRTGTGLCAGGPVGPNAFAAENGAAGSEKVIRFPS